jgi:biopolymer transport protein ExbB
LNRQDVDCKDIFQGRDLMTVANLLAQGGWAMWPIYLCSVLALGIFCERLWMFRQLRMRSTSWVDDILQRAGAMHFEAAASLAQSSAHPLARVLRSALILARTRPDRVAAEAERVGRQEIADFERFLPSLGLIAQIAPLLGLLGTVLGMVQLFFGLQGAGMANVNAAALSAGIWQALLTTAAGLVVAAPTMAAHHYLNGRIEMLRLQLRDGVERLLHVMPPLQTPWRDEEAEAKGASQESSTRGALQEPSTHDASQGSPKREGEGQAESDEGVFFAPPTPVHTAKQPSSSAAISAG